MDRLKQIESFAAVATKGSLTAAAHAEGVAPAVIGRRIDGLESRLGVKLLVRTTRRITFWLRVFGSSSTNTTRAGRNGVPSPATTAARSGPPASAHRILFSPRHSS